jgi:FkbM family methyltransferase
MYLLKQTVLSLVEKTPYRLRKILPNSTLDAVELALTCYWESNPQATLVQIGACDGVTNDPISGFIQRRSINAVLVEPIEHSFQKLEAVYGGIPSVKLVQAAIALQDGTATFYKVREAGRWADSTLAPQWSSFNKQHLLKHGVKENEIEAITVPCLSLRSLMARFDLDKIDFLQVDTEGFDGTVVAMALNLPHLPDCINFENAHLNSDERESLFRDLNASEYVWSHNDLNTLAVHRSVIQRWSKSLYQSSN